MLNLSRWVRSKVAFVSVFAGFLAPSAQAMAASEETDLVHDMSLCEAPQMGQALVRVAIIGLRDLEGNIRVQIYGDDPDDFLAKGTKLARVDVKTEAEGQKVCMPMPAPGDYRLVVMHDRNANGKADFFTEGFGFSNNPKLGLAPPDAEDVLFSAAEGVTEMEVSLKYVFGADEEQKKKRRQLRRR